MSFSEASQTPTLASVKAFGVLKNRIISIRCVFPFAVSFLHHFKADGNTLTDSRGVVGIHRSFQRHESHESVLLNDLLNGFVSWNDDTKTCFRLIIKTYKEDDVAILSAQIMTFKSSRNLTLLTHSCSVTQTSRFSCSSSESSVQFDRQ